MAGSTTSGWQYALPADNVADWPTTSQALANKLEAALPGSTLPWVAYTPTWGAATTAPAIGNGTIFGRYRLIGKTCHFRIGLSMGSTTTYGSGQWNLSLPVPMAADPIFVRQLFPCFLFDSSPAGTYPNGNGFPVASGTSTLNLGVAIPASGLNASLSSTSPFTWAAGDALGIWGTYEAA